MKSAFSVRQVGWLATALAMLAMAPQLFADSSGYLQTNLVSNGATTANVTDPNLVNPWGIVASPTSPWWTSDQGTGVSTLFTGTGSVVPLVVSIPAPNPKAPTGPTGIVFNGTKGFDIPGPNSTSVQSIFIFATLNGTIAGWNPKSNGGLGSALSAVSNPGAVYTGLAINNDGTSIYAANFASGKIDVFNSSFASATLAGSFTDPNLPKGWAPYNIQNVGGQLYVEYSQASKGFPVIGAGDGIVDVFNADGTFAKRLITGGALDVPWGITLAPSGFGKFSNDLLVGNFGNGEINAFDPSSGAFLGTLDSPGGQPLVNDFLWGIGFGNGHASGSTNTLYFNAGVDNQQGGLFGSINATPEPATLFLLGSGLVGLAGFRRPKSIAS